MSEVDVFDDNGSPLFWTYLEQSGTLDRISHL